MSSRGCTRRAQRGGGCGCDGGSGGSWFGTGGYRATRRNKALLAKYRRGGSIGFTATASLKAKGLLPRTSRKNRGKKIVSSKYK